MDNTGLFVVVTLAVIFVIPYLYMRISALRSVGKPVPALDQISAIESNTSQAVFLYFMSKNCSMCKSMSPVIEKLESDNPNIVTIDINQSPELAKNFHVYGTPTLMKIKDGFIKKVKLGKLSKRKIDQFIDD